MTYLPRIIAGVVVGLFLVATGYFTLNMIAMAALSQALGQ